MKAIHNPSWLYLEKHFVVLYPKDTEKWKQFTTSSCKILFHILLFCIPKILKNESNSQLLMILEIWGTRCFVSQRYWKMKAIHNVSSFANFLRYVVLYPKDTEKWKQFTTRQRNERRIFLLFCIPKILKNESNSQLVLILCFFLYSCFVSQRYWKMKAIHNLCWTKPSVALPLV